MVEKILTQNVLSKKWKKKEGINKWTNQKTSWANDFNRHVTKENIQMANKPMKDVPHERSSGKCKLSYHHTPIWMVKIWNTDKSKCWRGRGATGTLIHGWWGRKMLQPLWKTVWCFLTKLNVLLPYDLAIILLDTYPNEWKTYVHVKTCMRMWKTYVHVKTCTRMFIAALFIIAKTRKQPRCPSTGEWIKKKGSMYTMKY